MLTCSNCILFPSSHAPCKWKQRILFSPSASISPLCCCCWWDMVRSYAAAAAILFRCLQCQQLLLQAVWKQGEESLCLLPAVLLLLLLLLLLYCETRIKSTPDLGSLRQVVQQFAHFWRGRKARKQEGRGIWIISQASKQARRNSDWKFSSLLRAREREKNGRREASGTVICSAFSEASFSVEHITLILLCRHPSGCSLPPPCLLSVVFVLCNPLHKRNRNLLGDGFIIAKEIGVVLAKCAPFHTIVI